MLDLSIVIVSWNTADLFRACLRSLASGGDEPRQVVVVDNASSDGSAGMVEHEFPSVRLVRNASNAGFSAANNAGIAVSSSSYLLLLNSDTFVPAGALAGLVNFMDGNPRVGVCGPRLLRPDGTPQPYGFGQDPTIGYLVRRGLTGLLLGRHLHDWGLATTEDVDWVSGACLMTRRAVIDQVGGLDERIFMYFEDNDFCLRARKAGWRVAYVPAAQITHFGGQSLALNPAARQEYARSLLYFHRKHYGALSRLILSVILPVYGRAGTVARAGSG